MARRRCQAEVRRKLMGWGFVSLAGFGRRLRDWEGKEGKNIKKKGKGKKTETLLNKLSSYKKAVRIFNKSSLRAHNNFNKFQLLKLKQIRHFQILKFMYKFTHGLLSSGFNDYFCTQSDIHTYNTRTASHSALGISFARTNRRKKSLKVKKAIRGMICP